MEGYQWGEGGEKMGEKVWGIRSTNGRYKIDRERLKKWYRKQRTQRTYMYNTWT